MSEPPILLVCLPVCRLKRKPLNLRVCCHVRRSLLVLVCLPVSTSTCVFTCATVSLTQDPPILARTKFAHNHLCVFLTTVSPSVSISTSVNLAAGVSMSASALFTESKVNSVSTLHSVSVSASLSSSALVFRFWQCVTSCLILYFDTLLGNLSMSSSDLIWVSISWHVCKIVTTGVLACNSSSVSPSVSISISASLPANISTSFLQLRWPDCVHVSRPSLLLACYAVCKKGLSV